MSNEVMVEYRTRDLYLAAYLKALGVPFKGSEKIKGRVFFIFKRDRDIADLKRAFFSREAQVSALTYADELRALKTLCHL